MESQKDYYDGMERDIDRVIRKNNQLLSNQSPMQRMKFALREIRRDKKPAESKKEVLPAQSVTTPKQASPTGKDPSEMTADELKAFMIAQGIGIAEN